MKLALDTNIFNNKAFCIWLLNTEEEKYLPAFAYMEYLYYHLKKGNSQNMVDTFLKQMNVTVTPFGKEEAMLAVANCLGNWDFSKNARDYAIGATAIKMNAKLVTNNTKHFKWLPNILTPQQILDNL